ncbi:MAG: sodium ion-translocating decarboxylase subunit beta [Clostridia bacterium]|nr:sodium ion-translocating decarboxylase subunit beta [Clostridia bacterium]
MSAIKDFLGTTGIAQMFSADSDTKLWQYLAMYVIIGALFYLAIVKKFEPLLLMPIAFGMLLANLPGAELIHLEFFFDEYYFAVENGQITGTLALQVRDFIYNFLGYEEFFTLTNDSFAVNMDAVISAYNASGYQITAADINDLFQTYVSGAYLDAEGIIHIKMSTVIQEVINNGGLVDILYLGVKLGVYPSLIFMGVGAMTDFSPLIANPKSLLMGAGAQFGVFVAFMLALFLGFTPTEAGAIGIIGGADGPTAILVTKELAPHLLGAIAIAAYSYMALIPIIQPPFMKLLTTDKERKIKMTNLRSVSKTEKILFPIIVTGIVCLIIPDAAPLVGFLMLGNLLNVSGVADRLSKTAQNELINIITIFLGISVGATANAANFLRLETLFIIGLGLLAFVISTCGGLVVGKIMCKLTGGKINPLIGSAGVSAVPMAARVSQDMGRRYDPSNFLLMHAMGPNVAGVIGSAVAAGVFLSFLR